MKVLAPTLVKASVLDLIHTTMDFLFVCTFSYDFTSVEIFEFIQLIERGVVIDIIAGKELPTETFSKLARLYNIAVYHLPLLHAKIYFNEDEAIVTSCNFGNLTVPKLYECGVRFSKREFRIEHEKLEEQIKFLKSEANLLLPRMPRSSERKGVDLRDFL